MPLFEEIVNGFRRECADDYVGLWQISRALKDFTGESHTEDIVSVVAALLEHHAITVGQFEGGRFVEWAGSREERMDRIRRELLQLGTEPDIGDVAWLVERRG
jgi:class 3 adenylate cyclase